MHRKTLRLVWTVTAILFPLLAAFVVTDTHQIKNSPRTQSPTKLFRQIPIDNEGGYKQEEGDESTDSGRTSSSPGISHDQEEAPREPYGLLFQKPDADPFRADFRDTSEPKLMTTFGGGTALMFEMIAKRMLDWGNEARPYATNGEQMKPSSRNRSTTKGGKSTAAERTNDPGLPRWHPHPGISDSNPNFRSQAPVMNNQGKRTIKMVLVLGL